jgi:hypothetical protein
MPTPFDAEAAALREQVLAGYAPKRQIAKAFGRTIRTVDRWKVTLNLKVIRVGNEEFLELATLRRALTGEGVEPTARNRGRGRPRKHPVAHAIEHRV